MAYLESHFSLAHDENVPSPPLQQQQQQEQEEDYEEWHYTGNEELPPRSKYERRTNNLVKLIRMTGSGDLFAIPYPHAKAGYKCRNAYGYRPVFQDETTNSYFQNAALKNTAKMLTTKKLIPYHPNAPCNRSPQTYKNEVGTRFNDCRNASYLSLYDGVPKHLHTPKTTNQLFMQYKLDPVGNSNPAIFSAAKQHIHPQAEAFWLGGGVTTSSSSAAAAAAAAGL